ncbi:MAG TPA: hypothetical protein VH541_09220 [Gaiellaceae bacterium]
MRFPGRCELRLDADVQLSAAAECEPCSAAGAERLRLFELLETEQFAEEATRLGLTARRGRDLDVVELDL